MVVEDSEKMYPLALSCWEIYSLFGANLMVSVVMVPLEINIFQPREDGPDEDCLSEYPAHHDKFGIGCHILYEVGF